MNETDCLIVTSYSVKTLLRTSTPGSLTFGRHAVFNPFFWQAKLRAVVFSFIIYPAQKGKQSNSFVFISHFFISFDFV